ncbi:MFS transporter (plasmid) [Parasedimentitalea marina]|uniref:MFS transporter n=1 Tax=Parasedimentitalea marina TaxID=2483033 RepID=A0A3T0N9Z6_9RHOB|nr:MFS transporter [Parasedimentitalea marina]
MPRAFVSNSLWTTLPTSIRHSYRSRPGKRSKREHACLFTLTGKIIDYICYYKKIGTNNISICRQNFNTPRAYVYRHAVAQLFLWGAFYYLLPAISTLIVAETGWPVLHISVSFTLAFLVWALCAPVVGICIDRGWGGAVMIAGGLLGAFVLAVLSIVSDLWVFSCALMVLGMCMAATLYDPCFAVMMRRLGGHGESATATVTLIAGFATLLTFPLVLVLSKYMEWREIILVFAVLACVAVCFLPSQDRRELQALKSGDGPPFKIETAPVLIALSFGLIMLGHAILLFLLPVVLVKEGGAAAIGLLAVAILGPAQIAGRLVWRALGHRFDLQVGAVVLFILFCVPPIVLVVFGPSAGVVYLALGIQGASYGVHTILRPTLARLYLPTAHLGRGLGSIATVGLVMMALGPALGGVMWRASGFTGLMGSVLVLDFLGFCLILVLVKFKPDERCHDQ